MTLKRTGCVLLALMLVFTALTAAGEGSGKANGIPLLVNREHPLPDDHVPVELVLLSEVIPEGLCSYEHEGMLAEREAAEAWVTLLTAAHADGLSEWRFSEAYRTGEEQQRLFDETVRSYILQYGMTETQATEAAMYLAAPAGASEHQTGLAFDMTVPGEYFGDTAQYLWMKRHCAEYGFILRYTDEKEDITGYMSEEWHYRYVGKEHALRMEELDMCLEEYILYLSD